MLKKHPKTQCRSMLTALYLSPTSRPDYSTKPYHRTLPLYQTAPQNHTTVPHHTTKSDHCTTPYPKAVPQNFISWYLFVGLGLCECTPKPYPENRTPKPYPRKCTSMYVRIWVRVRGTVLGYGSGVRFWGTVFGVRFWSTVLGYGTVQWYGRVLSIGYEKLPPLSGIYNK